MPFTKGHKINFGRECSEKTKLKISKAIKGHIVSKEAREKISKANKGRKAWNKNLRGYRHSGSFKKGHPSYLTKISKEKISVGLKVAYKTRKRVPIKYTGWNNGLKRPPEVLKKISGKNASNWQGGVSKEPYSFDFTKELKEIIRKRDNYTCQICGRKWKENTISFSIHHIDFNKKNCNPNNLITLCKSCHTKTNHNRDYWINYFRKLTGTIRNNRATLVSAC